MAGRFPYDPRDPGQRGQPQQPQQQQPENQQYQLSAQMRAALGLTGNNGLEDALFLQQQRQHDLQRDLRLRQMLLQQQLEQENKFAPMLQDQQLRALGEHLQEYPELQQRYHTLLLREQLQQEERAMLEAQAQMRYQEELRLLQAQQQQQEPYTAQEREAHAQALAEAQQTATQGQSAQSQSQAQATPSSATLLRELAADSLTGNAVRKTENDRKRSASEDRSPARSPVPPSGAETEVPPAKRPAKEKKTKNKIKTSPKSKKKAPLKASTAPGKSPQIPLQTDEKPSAVTPKPSLKPPPNGSVGFDSHAAVNPAATTEALPGGFAAASRSDAPQATHFPGHFQAPFPPPLQTPTRPPIYNALQNSLQAPPHSVLHETPPHMVANTQEPHSILAARFGHLTPGGYQQEAFAAMSPSVAETMELNGYVHDDAIPRFGTVQGILAAAETDDKMDDALDTLRSMKKVVWEESDDESAPVKQHEAPQGFSDGEYVKLADGFVTALPLLPEEPLYEGPLMNDARGDKNESLWDDGSASGIGSEKDGSMDVDQATGKTRVVSNVLEYPYPIDVWWPSIDSIRKERRARGEESDEDDFEEEPELAKEQPPLRANFPVIRKRLARDLRPGVLEKIPHCKIHRLLMRQKKNLSVPDLVFCWQVTDIYPNDTMVCCSKCGTWRHAACGGHHEPYSVRKNIETPFVPVCDFCHEEEKILQDYPNAQKRLERQRMEQIRRALATTSVMRHASFSKHGAYKWPLGRVSGTHISGHTRSVNSRHDKAEKQWADMAKRLSSEYGGRPRERARVRTKELERLLVSVEDAEAYTDRHNILLFLMRDTVKEHPVGFEKERKNIFDPEEDRISEAEEQAEMEKEEGDVSGKEASSDAKTAAPSREDDATEDEPKPISPSRCARVGCTRKPRFDSRFCSDSCGVAALELDLLHSFQESSDIHPSVLRN